MIFRTIQIYCAVFAVLVSCILVPTHSFAQEALKKYFRLWENGVPGFESRRSEPEQAKDYWVKNINNPSLQVVFPPAGKANGTAVVVCPGGGFRLLVYNAEGTEPAEYLAKLGITVFILKYRLPREEGSPYSLEKAPREDALRAMRQVRSRAKEYNIDPGKVGMLGFSAGGEVVAAVAYASGKVTLPPKTLSIVSMGSQISKCSYILVRWEYPKLSLPTRHQHFCSPPTTILAAV
jgi:acetyl esterase/lipase